MRRARLLAAICASALVPATAPASSPSFVPNPRQAFQGYVAINAPRPDVPVGALWIDGFGPTGSAAPLDNLETVRSLNGVTIDKGLQLALTAGLFSMFGIEPRLRDRYTARFTDLTIVRVKEVSQLAGPKGEPRIIEALKAASITISRDGEIGLSARTTGWQQRDIEGVSSNGRSRNYAIEGRNLFIAMRIATPRLVTGKESALDITSAGPANARARIDDYLITMEESSCAAGSRMHCPPASYGVVKLNSYPVSKPQKQVESKLEAETKLTLPVPVADGDGGLFDSLIVRWVAPCGVRRAEHCRKEPRLLVRYVGTALEDFTSPDAKGW